MTKKPEYLGEPKTGDLENQFSAGVVDEEDIVSTKIKKGQVVKTQIKVDSKDIKDSLLFIKYRVNQIYYFILIISGICLLGLIIALMVAIKFA